MSVSSGHGRTKSDHTQGAGADFYGGGGGGKKKIMIVRPPHERELEVRTLEALGVFDALSCYLSIIWKQSYKVGG